MFKLMVDLDATIFPTYTELDILHKILFGTESNWKGKNYSTWKSSSKNVSVIKVRIVQSVSMV